MESSWRRGPQHPEARGLTWAGSREAQDRADGGVHASNCCNPLSGVLCVTRHQCSLEWDESWGRVDLMIELGGADAPSTMT